jgi:hypothetical protein
MGITRAGNEVCMSALSIKNNWEYYTYFIDGKEVSPLEIKSVRINSKTYAIIPKETIGSYSDFGHSSVVHRTSLFITVDGFEIDLSKQMDKNNPPTVKVVI